MWSLPMLSKQAIIKKKKKNCVTYKNDKSIFKWIKSEEDLIKVLSEPKP